MTIATAPVKHLFNPCGLKIITLLCWAVLTCLMPFGSGIDNQASAQQILLQEKTLFSDLEKDGFGTVELVNGPFAYRSAAAVSDSDITPFLPFMLAVLAHDQISDGHYSAETVVSDIFAAHSTAGDQDTNFEGGAFEDTAFEDFEDKAFTVPLRIMHLLTASAGYAVPGVDPSLYRGPAAPLLLRRRTPGRMAHRDPVGHMILARVIERTAGKPLQDVITDRFLAPFDIASDTISLNATTMPSGQIAHQARRHLMKLMIKPRLLAGDTPKLRYSAALFDDPLLEPFPLGPYHTLGLHYEPVAGADMLVSRGDTSCIIGHREAGIMIMLFDPAGCQHPVPNALTSLIKNQIIDRRAAARLDTLKRLEDRGGYPISFSGHYLDDTTPRADLASKLDRLMDGGWRVSTLTSGMLRLRRGTDLRYLTPTGPYRYIDTKGDALSFSIYRRGGFMRYEGRIFREQGLLANKNILLWPVPFMLIVLMMAGIFWREAVAPEWRRMARLGVMASLFTAAGIAAEYYAYTGALYGDIGGTGGIGGAGLWLILGWRILFNTGLAFALAVSILAIVISRKGLLPEGAKFLIASPMLILLAASGIGLLVMMTGWGMVGELWPID